MTENSVQKTSSEEELVVNKRKFTPTEIPDISKSAKTPAHGYNENSSSSSLSSSAATPLSTVPSRLAPSSALSSHTGRAVSLSSNNSDAETEITILYQNKERVVVWPKEGTSEKAVERNIRKLFKIPKKYDIFLLDERGRSHVIVPTLSSNVVFRLEVEASIE